MPDDLPKHLLKKASKKGNEYAWKLSDVEEVVSVAKNEGFAILGGQAQFRLPDATCEMYWIMADPRRKSEQETWLQYVNRSSREFISLFKANVLSVDFKKEAEKWPFLSKKMVEGVNVLDYLCFVIYFKKTPLDIGKDYFDELE